MSDEEEARDDLVDVWGEEYAQELEGLGDQWGARIIRDLIDSGKRRRSPDPLQRQLQTAMDQLRKRQENEMIYGRRVYEEKS